MPFVLAVIADGFADSLWQALTSAWMLVPLAVALAMGVFFLLLFRALRHSPPRPAMPCDVHVDLPDLPRGGPELDDDVAEVIREWADEWEKQKGDRRG